MKVEKYFKGRITGLAATIKIYTYQTAETFKYSIVTCGSYIVLDRLEYTVDLFLKKKVQTVFVIQTYSARGITQLPEFSCNKYE